MSKKIPVSTYRQKILEEFPTASEDDIAFAALTAVIMGVAEGHEIEDVSLITPDELRKMRAELQSQQLPGTSPPKGREYWDAHRIVATLEHYMKD